VKYTITPNEKWSNGTSFNGNDLLGWWLRARALRTVLSDGYRDIKTLSVSKDGDVVTAVFATPYATGTCSFETSRRWAPRAVVRSRRCWRDRRSGPTRSPARRRVASC